MNRKNYSISVTITIFTLLLSPVWAGTQFYGADLTEVKWQSSGNRLECRLSQNIPGYGEVIFRHHALEAMEFRVSVNDVPRKPGQAILYVKPPIWKRSANRKVLGRVAFAANKDIIVVPEDWAYRMAFELREGMEATWSHADVGDGEDLVIAKAMPMYFEPAWRDFKRCGENLIEYGLEDVEFSAFYFTKGTVRLKSKEKSQLDRLAEYVSLDSKFEYIQINSHTDSRGLRRRNLAVSQRRAKLVKDYLVKQGVSPEKFVVVAKGEKKPRYNNRTKSGREKNRRVEILLVK